VSYLLDTMVLSEPARPAPNPEVIAWLRAQSPLDLSISVLTLGELEKGVALLPRSRRRTALETWLRTDLPRQFTGRVLPIDEAIAYEWGRLTAAGQRSCHPLPVIDGLLLATAAVHQLTLVTRNERDCKRRGVPIYNPWPV
jgi:predicted nucleic acid-binding protein